MRLVSAGLLILFVASGVAEADQSGLPKRSRTPGLVRTDLTLTQICKIKWGTDPRAVSQSMKQGVFASYGFSGNNDPKCNSSRPNRRCEIDHLVPRSIGGADDARNLWPQPYYQGTWNATVKDKLETRMHKVVCDKTVPLADRERLLRHARRGFMTDWKVLFREYYNAP